MVADPRHSLASGVELHIPKGFSGTPLDLPLSATDGMLWRTSVGNDLLRFDTTNRRLDFSNATDPYDFRIIGGQFIFNGSNIVLNPTGNFFLSMGALKIAQIDVSDDLSDAFTVVEGANDYISVDTTNSAERLIFGNVNTDPDFLFRGSGTTTFDGSSMVFSSNFSLDPVGLFQVNMDSGKAFSVFLSDNLAGALNITQGAFAYLNITTLNGAETIFFGNASINPKFVFNGSGELQFGATAGTAGQVLTSNGAGTNPTWQDSGSGDFSNGGDTGPTRTLGNIDASELGFITNNIKRFFISADGEAQFNGKLTMNSGELLVDNGPGLRIKNTVVLSLGTANEFRMEHTGTFTKFTSDKGKFLINQNIAGKDIELKLGANTASEKLAILDNSSVVLFSALGDGTINISKSGGKVGLFGVTAVAQSAAYTPTNVVSDRTYDADATSVAELADVLGTLIADLQALGPIG